MRGIGEISGKGVLGTAMRTRPGPALLMQLRSGILKAFSIYTWHSGYRSDRLDVRNSVRVAVCHFSEVARKSKCTGRGDRGELTKRTKCTGNALLDALKSTAL